MRKLAATALAALMCGLPLRAAADNTPATPDPSFTPSKAIGRTHDCISYFDESRRLYETGDIVVSYDVGADGVISNVRVIKSSGFARLDDGALACVRERWRNTPAMLNGTPVASPGHQALISFALPKPVSAEDFYSVGVMVGGRGDYQQALSDLTEAIALAPDAVNAYRARALVFDALGQTDLAKADRDKADMLDKAH